MAVGMGEADSEADAESDADPFTKCDRAGETHGDGHAAAVAVIISETISGRADANEIARAGG